MKKTWVAATATVLVTAGLLAAWTTSRTTPGPAAETVLAWSDPGSSALPQTDADLAADDVVDLLALPALDVPLGL